MNQYTITNIDPATNTVKVTYDYNGQTLDDTLSLEGVTDPAAITEVVQAGYATFQASVDAKTSAPTLTSEVQALVGVPVSVEANAAEALATPEPAVAETEAV